MFTVCLEFEVSGYEYKGNEELIKYENENLFTMALYYQPIFLITSDKIGDIQKGTPQFCINWGIQNWNVQ